MDGRMSEKKRRAHKKARARERRAQKERERYELGVTILAAPKTVSARVIAAAVYYRPNVLARELEEAGIETAADLFAAWDRFGRRRLEDALRRFGIAVEYEPRFVRLPQIAEKGEEE